MRTTTVELTHLDLLNLQTLVTARITEIETHRDKEHPNSIPNQLLDEALGWYKGTFDRITGALKKLEAELVNENDEFMRDLKIDAAKKRKQAGLRRKAANAAKRKAKS